MGPNHHGRFLIDMHPQGPHTILLFNTSERAVIVTVERSWTSIWHGPSALRWPVFVLSDKDCHRVLRYANCHGCLLKPQRLRSFEDVKATSTRYTKEISWFLVLAPSTPSDDGPLTARIFDIVYVPLTDFSVTHCQQPKTHLHKTQEAAVNAL